MDPAGSTTEGSSADTHSSSGKSFGDTATAAAKDATVRSIAQAICESGLLHLLLLELQQLQSDWATAHNLVAPLLVPKVGDGWYSCRFW